MEQLLAFVVFGVLGLITIYGYVTSARAARESARGGVTQDRPMAGVAAEGATGGAYRLPTPRPPDLPG